MIHAYDKVYLEEARAKLGGMLDFAVYDLEYELTAFYDLFLQSGIAIRFGEGDFTIISGKSGVEIVYEVMECMQRSIIRKTPRYAVNKSPEYWTGWAIAYYQWITGFSFSEINHFVPIAEVRDMYSPYHEMDIRHLVEYLNKIYSDTNPDTRLKKYRKQMGLSQKRLAEITGISVRTIQQYEQRQKNINKAQADTVVVLAQALCVKAEDIMEKIQE